AKNAGIEYFLTAAVEKFRQAAGEQRHQARAEDAGANAARDPCRAAGHARGHGHDDTDDQACFEDLAEDDQQRREHGTLISLHCTIIKSLHDQKALRLTVEIVVEIVASRLLRPHITDGLAA